MKKLLVTAGLVTLVLMDWAALDDITTGNEPDYWGEWMILIVSGVVLGWLGLKRLRKGNVKAG